MERRPTLALAALTLLLFGDVLFGPAGRVVSAPGADGVNHFVSSRAFGFGELARGNLALWNPQLFAGYPFLGGYQPALLYPPNWLHLILSPERAINVLVALHVFLAGWFTSLWLRHGHARAGPAAALLAGVAFMCCARVFGHVYAGHLPHLSVLPWVPLLLLALESQLERPRLACVLLGAAAIALMILAGCPQLLYYVALIAPLHVALYVLLHAAPLRRSPSAPASAPANAPAGTKRAGLVAALPGLLAMGVLALGLGAVQILAGRDAMDESVRSGGTRYGFAASFAMPPENLLTLVAPDVLGPIAPTDSAPLGYFGESYLWEASTFVGAAVLWLALVGAFAGAAGAGGASGAGGAGSAAGAAGAGGARVLAALALLTALLGLGPNTPLHRWLYDVLPGFDVFRGTSKFYFLTSLYLAALAARGYERVARGRTARAGIVAAAAGALLLLAAGLAVRVSANDGPDGFYGRALAGTAERAERWEDLYYDPARWSDAGALALAADSSAGALLSAAGWMGGVALLALLARRRPRAAGALLLLATAELFLFARAHRPVSAIDPPLPAAFSAALDALPADARFLRNPSLWDGLVRRRPLTDAWGYDPGVLRRYAELMYAGQSQDPDELRSDLAFVRESPGVLRTARVALVLEASPRVAAHRLSAPPLPRALLVPSARVLPGRDAILSAMLAPGFDPAATVLLETPPGLALADVDPSRAGATALSSRPESESATEPVPVPVRDLDSDTRVFDVQVQAASILLVTEAYSRHWKLVRTEPAPPGQPQDRVLPGDWAFLAVPLAPGRHAFRLEYAPDGVALGGALSLGTLAVFGALCVVALRRGRGGRRARGAGSDRGVRGVPA